MELSKRLTNSLLKNVYPIFIVFMLIFISVNALLVFSFNLISISIMFTVIAMFMGQVLLLTPFSIAYPFYFFSCFCGTTISMLFWLARIMPSIPVYLVSFSILITVPLVVHLYTRTRIQTIPMLRMFSFFLFGLLIIFGVSQTPTISNFDTLFQVTIVLFVLVSIFGLNLTFRTMVLNKELKIRDGNNYLRKAKEDLLKKFASDYAHAEIDLLIYYLSSSIDSFIDGDFERSFMDAYKIAFDNQRKAFKAIYVLPEDKEQSGRFAAIRDNLSHAHVRENRKGKEEPEKKEYLKKLKEAKKKLFRDTLDLLKIVRYDFIDAALKEEQTRLM